MKVTMRALRSLPYGGVRHQPGGIFEASRKDARALAAIRKAEVTEVGAFADGEEITLPAPTQAPTPEEIAAPPRRRAYRRRDLQAEGSH